MKKDAAVTIIKYAAVIALFVGVPYCLYECNAGDDTPGGREWVNEHQQIDNGDPADEYGEEYLMNDPPPDETAPDDSYMYEDME